MKVFTSLPSLFHMFGKINVTVPNHEKKRSLEIVNYIFSSNFLRMFGEIKGFIR